MADEDVSDGLLSQDSLDALIAAASAQTGDEEAAWQGAEDTGSNDPMQSAIDLPSFGGVAPTARDGDESMSRIKDIPLEVTVELGRTRLLIRDILDLNAGSIVELEKIAGEPVDLLANGLLVARGEVIVIDDNFGVRLTEIITARERSEAQGNNGTSG